MMLEEDLAYSTGLGRAARAGFSNGNERLGWLDGLIAEVRSVHCMLTARAKAGLPLLLVRSMTKRRSLRWGSYGTASRRFDVEC